MFFQYTVQLFEAKVISDGYALNLRGKYIFKK